MKNVTAYPRAALLLFLTGLLGTTVAYWHGLHGNFIFDDFQTLESLGDFNGVRNWETFLLYMQSGHAGPTGRPVSMLSFLLNAQNWPADPYPFKATNLILHLACGSLLNLVIFRLMTAAFPARTAWECALIALCASAWWLLNPLHVSTTLYVVQRMTQLATIFTLLGMLGYLHGRAMLGANSRHAYTWMTGAIVVMGALATLSKENGALLPFLIGLMEIMFLRARPENKLFRWWKMAFLWLPSFAILGYLAWIGYQSSGTVLANRDFSIHERLLTESRILWQYLYQLILPRLDGGSFFGDDIAISSSLISPSSTLLATLGWLITATCCWFGRKRYPLLSFSLLFFLVGHLIESTTIPLELYFEHRNYLPSMFLALPVAAAAAPRLAQRHAMIIAGALGIAILLGSMTWHRASLWGKTDELYIYWALQSPYSPRAQTTAIGAYLRMGRQDLAFSLAQAAVDKNPKNLLLRLQWLSMLRLHAADQPEVTTVRTLALTAPYEIQALAALKRMTEQCENAPCNTIETSALRSILDHLLKNPAYRANAARLIPHLVGRLYLVDQNIDAASASFSAIPIDAEYPDTGMLQFSLLANHGYFKEAQTQLDRVKTAAIEYNLPQMKQEYYLREIARMEKTLREDMQHASPRAGAANTP